MLVCRLLGDMVFFRGLKDRWMVYCGNSIKAQIGCVTHFTTTPQMYCTGKDPFTARSFLFTQSPRLRKHECQCHFLSQMRQFGSCLKLPRTLELRKKQYVNDDTCSHLCYMFQCRISLCDHVLARTSEKLGRPQNSTSNQRRSLSSHPRNHANQRSVFAGTAGSWSEERSSPSVSPTPTHRIISKLTKMIKVQKTNEKLWIAACENQGWVGVESPAYLEVYASHRRVLLDEILDDIDNLWNDTYINDRIDSINQSST